MINFDPCDHLKHLHLFAFIPSIPAHDFHWCYEGNCGPEFWETRFEDCAGESQSPIDVEWPE